MGAMFWAISLVVMDCSSTAEAMVLETSLTLPITLVISPIAVTRLAGGVLNRLDAFSDIVGGLGRLLGQFLDLGGDDRETLAGVTCPGGLNGGVQGQQVGLLGDILNNLDDLARSRRRPRPAGRAFSLLVLAS